MPKVSPPLIGSTFSDLQEGTLKASSGPGCSLNIILSHMVNIGCLRQAEVFDLQGQLVSDLVSSLLFDSE